MDTKKVTIKNVNVAVMVLLTIITSGAYIGYWFISRKKTLNNHFPDNHIPFRWWVFFTVFLVLFFLNAIAGSIVFTPIELMNIEIADIIFTFYFLGILYYSLFRIQEQIEDFYEEKIFNRWLLFFFHLWYMQYKMNVLQRQT